MAVNLIPSEPLFITGELLSPLLHSQDAGGRVVHGFSTRLGGVSVPPFQSLNLGEAVGDRPEAVRENHRRLSVAMGAPEIQFAMVKQVHGDVCFCLDDSVDLAAYPLTAGGYLLGDADALISNRPEVVVGVRTADCVPILLAGADDNRRPVVAAVHAGWRGTVLNIVSKTVQLMRDRFAVQPESLRAVVGPCISGPTYPVGQEVVDGLERVLADAPGGTEGVVLPSLPDFPNAVARVALAEANRRLLREAGLSSAQIEVMDVCVVKEASLFFSHRRDHGNTGRMLNFIGLTHTLAESAQRGFSPVSLRGSA